ncbi:MAG: hypothetical protein IJH63_10090 [Methanobrevibacter sp.]|nr:hypothetical protein [Methanobrevibacter sp.]
MVIDGYLKESALIEIEESNNKNSSLLKEVTDKLAEYMMSNDYQSYSTNIRISQGTKDRLLDLKINPNESYEDVIIRLLS